MEQAVKAFELYPTSSPESVPADPHKQELFTRMVTSALVDADFLDTERHFGKGRPQAREHDLDIPTLWKRFEPGRERVLNEQREAGKAPAKHVQEVRDEVYSACLKAASGKPGGSCTPTPAVWMRTLNSQ